MQLHNKRNQKHIGENNLEDKSIFFFPNIGLGDLLFESRENQVVSILGKPFKTNRIVFENENNFSIEYEYSTFNLHIYFDYEEGIYDETSYFLTDIILDGFRFSINSKKRILEFIKSYHISYNYKYDIKNEYDKNVDIDYYYFRSIGLTIWFEGEDSSNISNICLSKVIK